MPAASTAPAAKAALKLLLEQHAWPTATPDIRWGGPTEQEDLPQGGELIYFAGVRITDDNYRLGAQTWDETYSLRIVIDTWYYGDDEQAAETRAWELYGEVLKILMAPRQTLNGTITYIDGENPRTVEQGTDPVPQGWHSQIVIDQPVVAVVTAP